MQKIIVIVAALLSLAAAALGVLNFNHLAQAKATADQLQQENSANIRKLDKATADLKAANDKVTSLSADQEKISSDLAQAKADADKAVAAQADLQKQINDKDASLSDQKSELDAKTQQLADLQSKLQQSSQQAGSPSDDLKRQLQEKDLLATSLQEKLKELEPQLAALKEREAQQRSKTMKPGLTGHILAVNTSWNFVVLSLGDRNGVVNGAEMLVYRKDQLLGKVRITSVEPSTSIADVVANSVPRSFTIQPGDSVIYPNPGPSDLAETATATP